MFGLRAGTDPRAVATTTPRPIRLLRELLADPKVAVTRGTTYDNRKYLAPAFFGQILRKYEGTRLGRQELEAEILEDLPGALWNRGVIEACRSAPCARRAARSRGRSRSPRCTSRARCAISAPSQSSKTRCARLCAMAAPGPERGTAAARVHRPTGSTRWSGPSAICWCSRC